MDIQGDYIVVKVVEGGGGSISPAFSEKYATEHLLQWKENLTESKTKGWVKVFDVNGMEYVLEDNKSLIAKWLAKY